MPRKNNESQVAVPVSDENLNGNGAVAVETNDSDGESVVVGKPIKITRGRPALGKRPPANCRELLDRIFKNNFPYSRIEVYREVPMLQIPDDKIPPGPSEAVIRACHGFGAGRYRIRVWNLDGEPYSFGTETIEIDEEEAGPPVTMNSFGALKQRSKQKSEDDEVEQVAKDLTITRLKKQKQEIEEEAEEKARKREEERKRASEMTPVQSLIEEMRRDRERQQKEMDELKRKLDQPKTSVTDIAAAVSAALKPLAEIASSFITASLTNKPADKGTDLKDLINTINSANEKTFQMMLKMIPEGGKKGDLTETLALLDHIENRAERIARRNGGLGDDEGIAANIDPENFWGSLGAMGVDMVVKMFRHGAPQIVQRIQAEINKPREQITDQDVENVYARLKSQGALAAPPQQIQPPPQQIPTQVRQQPVAPTRPIAPVATVARTFAPLRVFNPTLRVTPPPVKPVQAEHKPNQDATPNEAGTVALQQPPQKPTEQPAVAAVEAPPPSPKVPDMPTGEPSLNEKLEADLKETLEMVVAEHMLIDLIAGKSSHNWPYVLVDECHEEFKKKLVAAVDHSARMRLLYDKISPDLQRQLNEQLEKEGANLYNTMMGWTEFLRVCQGGAVPEPAASN